MRTARHALAGALIVTAARSTLLTCPGAWAQSVALTGILGKQALLVVDGGAPRSVAVGNTVQGVKVLAVQGDSATVEVAGRQMQLRLGDSPASVGARGGQGTGTRIVLTSDSQGHFYTQGSINGHVMQFLVDTGATVVAISQAEADRMRLNYKAGQQVRMATAGGMSTGWRVRLNTLRLGDIDVYDVDTVVMPTPMPFGLLGNSVLTRFQMTRHNDQLVLEKRY